MYAVGLMSGTSLDGIDAVLCEIEGSGISTSIKQIAFLTYPLSDAVKEEIRICCANEKARVDMVCSLNFKIGELFAQAVKEVCKKASIEVSELSYIASHGQTIYHLPKKDETHVASTLQIGESAVIAYQCKTQVIDDFRVMDMAAGGEGAPLVPFSEYILYGSESESIALQNIGGIGNVTVLPKGGSIDEVYAFDTGPGNMVIDEAMQILYHKSYDQGGEIASRGNLISSLCEELMAHPYLTMPIPKSTGREVFGEAFTKDILHRYQKERKEDMIATLTWFSAASIANQYEKFVLPKHKLSKVIIGGGGAHNKTLLNFLQEMLPNVTVMTQESVGYSSDAKEAIAFVILGNETLHNQFSNVPSATGAKEKVILGKITPAPCIKQ